MWKYGGVCLRSEVGIEEEAWVPMILGVQDIEWKTTPRPTNKYLLFDNTVNVVVLVKSVRAWVKAAKLGGKHDTVA